MNLFKFELVDSNEDGDEDYQADHDCLDLS